MARPFLSLIIAASLFAAPAFAHHEHTIERTWPVWGVAGAGAIIVMIILAVAKALLARGPADR